MDIITKVASAVETYLKQEGSGHDWQHIYRVWQTALKLAEEAGANTEIVSLAALLHDVDDYKLTNDPTSEEKLPTARKFMAEAGVETALTELVCTTIKSIGYSKSLAGAQTRSLEASILSDADMLDALGAVGLARTFTYCGHKGNGMFDPEALPREGLTQAEYRKNAAPSVTHCFEKLLKLRTLMVTKAGKGEAEVRHQRMVTFLNDFFTEAAAPPEWHQLLKQFR